MTTLEQEMSARVATKKVLTAAGAQAVIAAALAKAREIGVPMVVAVVDDAGLLKTFVREDGTSNGAVQWAINKAITAASFRYATDQLAEGLRSDPAAMASILALPNATLVPAGYPLTVDGAVVGGVGASGGMPDQDQLVAAAGAAALES